MSERPVTSLNKLHGECSEQSASGTRCSFPACSFPCPLFLNAVFYVFSLWALLGAFDCILVAAGLGSVWQHLSCILASSKAAVQIHTCCGVLAILWVILENSQFMPLQLAFEAIHSGIRGHIHWIRSHIQWIWGCIQWIQGHIHGIRGHMQWIRGHMCVGAVFYKTADAVFTQTCRRSLL